MAQQHGDRLNGNGSDSYWEGYSNYKTVASSITQSIDEALEAYARLDSFHREDVKISRDGRRLIAEARAKIKLAALKLVPELKDDAPNNEQYQQILARWLGAFEVDADSDSGTIEPAFRNGGPDGGYFEALDEIRLADECPAWLEDWVIDIRTAGWELGYLKAGRRQKDTSDLDPVDEQARQMFSE